MSRQDKDSEESFPEGAHARTCTRTHATLSPSFPLLTCVFFYSFLQAFTLRLVCLVCSRDVVRSPRSSLKIQSLKTQTTLYQLAAPLLLKHLGCWSPLWAVGDPKVPLSCSRLPCVRTCLPPRPPGPGCSCPPLCVSLLRLFPAAIFHL